MNRLTKLFDSVNHMSGFDYRNTFKGLTFGDYISVIPASLRVGEKPYQGGYFFRNFLLANTAGNLMVTKQCSAILFTTIVALAILRKISDSGWRVDVQFGGEPLTTLRECLAHIAEKAMTMGISGLVAGGGNSNDDDFCEGC